MMKAQLQKFSTNKELGVGECARKGPRGLLNVNDNLVPRSAA